MIRAVALLCLAYYLGHNTFWLVQGSIPPPAIMLTHFGLPSPTTGGTRSVLALLDGDLMRSLRHNCGTVPIIALLLITMWQVVWCRWHQQRIRLAPAVTTAWWLVLLLAWLAKLAQGPAYW